MKIFIGCSSSNDINNNYFNECKKLLEKIIPNNELVFGAYNNGIMGLAYDIAIKNSSNIIGICNEIYKDDLLKLKCNEKVITDTIANRIDILINKSDILIFLPGGIGTLAELFTAIDSRRNNELNKPIIIFNIDGFYDKLLTFMNKVYEEKFAKQTDKNTYLVTNDINEIIKIINKYDNK